MLNKILYGAFPISLLIVLYQALVPSNMLSFLDPYSMILNCIVVYSLGWILSSFVYKQTDQDYSLPRHIGIAALFAIPVVAIIFVPSYLYPYIVGKGFIFRFLAIVAFFAFVYLSITDEKYRPKVTPFVFGYFVFVFFMGLSTIFSMDPSRSFWSNYERMEGYINVISLFALILAATTLRLKELEWSRIFGVHMWVSGIVSSLGVLQYAIGSMGLSNFSSLPIVSLCLSQGAACRVDSTLGNSIYLGIYAALTFWLIMYAIFVKKVKGNVLPVLAAINLVAVYFSGTRGVWVGMILALGVLMVSKYYFDGNRKAVIGTILGGLLFVSIFASFILYANKNGIAQNVAIVQRFSSVNTLFARWNIWQTAVTSWSQKPIFGWGQENFIHAFNLNYNPAMYGQETYFDHPHNTYFGWLVFGGIFGFLAFLFMMFMSIFGIIKSQIENEEKNDLIIPIIFAAITTYLVHIFFVFDNLTSSLLIVLMSVYFGSQYSYGVLNISKVSDTVKNILKFILIILAIYFVYVSVYKPSYANLTTIQAMTYQQRAATQDPREILSGTKKLYEKAINMDTLGSYEIREFYLQKSLEYINLLPQVADESIKATIVDVGNSALAQFGIQIEKNPFDHRAHFMLGLYFLNIKNYDKAIEVLKKALDLAPNKQIALIYLAKAYLMKGDINNSSVHYEKAIAITPKNIPGYNQIRIEYIQVLMLANQDERALSIIKELMPTVNKDEFNQLVSQMMQVYSTRKDLKGVIKILNDALVLDPSNQNFVLWLAQAYVATGSYNEAVFTINKLTTSNPSIVAEFNQQLQKYMQDEQQKKAEEEAIKQQQLRNKK